MVHSSGVLATSIEQSRHRWLSDGVFERYWAKPSKKKVQVGAQNPAKESMVKLGICSLIVEPHVFDITLYTVREPQSAFVPQTVQQTPLPNAQYNPFANHGGYNPPIYNSPNTAPHLHHYSHANSNSSSLTLPPFNEAFAQFGPQGPTPLHRAPITAPMPSVPVPASQGTSGPSSTRHDKPESLDKPLESGTSPDPVIQMLATRAASDHDLKSLMKVVASGNASQKQLRDFQNHIDDLNAILKTRPSPTQSHNLPKPAVHGGQDYANQSLISTSTLGMAQTPTVPPIFTTAIPPSGPIKSESYPQYYSHVAQSLKAKTPGPYRTDISAIVFDFGGAGDRFLFPRFSILEYLPGGTQVIVSFLITRRGSAAISGSYKDNTSYYQPVTMRLSTPQPRTLEPLARVVAPADEVRKYMNSVFDKMSPAERIFLATRLPRTSEDTDLDKGASIVNSDQSLLRSVYSPPNSLFPLKP